MVEFPAQEGNSIVRDLSPKHERPSNAELLQDRAFLLREISLVRQEKLREQQALLMVINIADTTKYDEIISIFGYRLADDLLDIRLGDLEFITSRQPAFRVGYWSVALIFRSRTPYEFQSELKHLMEVLAQPVICRGIPVTIKASVGVCDLMRGLGAAEDLLQATYVAAQAGAASLPGWKECNYEQEADHRRAFALIADAANSLATPHEFSLRYQARIDLKTGRSNAVETFLRWRHPTLGTVTPDEFIPLIEMTGLIRHLTFWVLSTAVAQAASWHALGRSLKICVKISPKNLDEEDFPSRVSALLATHKLAPEFLELEFSERHGFSDVEAGRKRLRELGELGVNISIDDFGTGANSFWALEHFPANALKIDRRLIRSVADNARQQAMVKSIIRMAHDLNMYVVAEGVETKAILEMLLGWRCDYAEGWLINRPMPADAFTEWFSHRF